MPSCLIVGAHYRPPAKGILQALPLGHPLVLMPEPDNEHDPHAIRVELVTATLPPGIDADLTALCAGFGFDAALIRERERWHLGYVPRDRAATLSLDGPRPAKLAFAPDGKPTINWED